MPMTREEVKKYINKEVSEICDKIANLYGELWEQFLVNQGGMDSSLHDDKKRRDLECDELCKQVKALGLRVNFGQTRNVEPVVGSPLLPDAIQIYNERAVGLFSCGEDDLRLADEEQKEQSE